MTLWGRAASALFLVAPCAFGIASGDDGRDADDDAAAKASAALSDEATKAFQDVRPKLLSLGTWCGDFEQFLQRSRVADAMLAFDPDDAKAREWLGFKRQKNGKWKPGPWRAYADARPESQTELAKRRADVSAAFRACFVPFLDRCRAWTDVGLRCRIVRSLVDLAPDDEAMRELHDEALVDGKWTLRESVATPACRARAVAAATAARADAATPARLVEKDANGWATVVRTEGLSVFSDLSEADTQTVVSSALAGRFLFARIFDVDAPFPRDLRLYVNRDAKTNAAFLTDQRDLSPEKRERFGHMASYWLRPNECVEVRLDPVEMLDSATRQMISVLDVRGTQLFDAPPWFAEGAGMYLVYKLLGTRRTAMISTGSYAEDWIGREVAGADADWIAVARKMIDRGYALDVQLLIGLPINSMTKEDGLLSYALAAYFLEGRPKDAAAFLAALARKGTNVHRALAEGCGLDAEELQQRFVRWLHEIPAK